MGQASIELTHGVRRPAALRLLSDDRLARRAAEGDRGAFAVIFERHHQGLYRYCRAMLRHDEDACDALQSTFTRAIAALDGDARSVAIRPWLYRIAHNESISLLRRRRPVDALGSQPDLRSAAPGPDDRVLSSERMRQLLADLEQLPERQRWALLLRELNDLSYADIAAAISTTEQAARQSVYEARVMLMELKEGRDMPCADVRQLISERDGRLLRPRKVRAHLRACEPCTEFRAAIGARRADLAALAPPLPAAAAAAVLSALLGGGGGGLGGGGLLAALTAGKGVVAGAGSKGLATAAALTIAGGTLVTTGGTLPQLGRDERDRTRPPALKAPGTLRASAPVQGPAVLAFPGHHDTRAPAVPQTLADQPAQALGERAPHEPPPASPAPAPATPLPDNVDRDEPAPVAGDGAPASDDRGAAGPPPAQQETETAGTEVPGKDDDGSGHGDEGQDDVRGSGRREGRGADEQDEGPPAHASSSAPAPRPGDSDGSAPKSNANSLRGNSADESPSQDEEARERSRGNAEAKDSARGREVCEAEEEDEEEDEDEDRARGDRGRDEDTRSARDRESPPGDDDRPGHDDDTRAADNRRNPPRHDDDARAADDRKNPPGHDDASDDRKNPPRNDDDTRAAKDRNDPPGRDATANRADAGPVAAQRDSGGGPSKGSKPAR